MASEQEQEKEQDQDHNQTQALKTGPLAAPTDNFLHSSVEGEEKK